MSNSDSIFNTIDDCWNRIGVWGHATPRCPKLESLIHCHACNVYGDAGRKLRDRPQPDGYMEEWGRHYAQPLRRRALDVSEAVLIFRIGREWLALPARYVEEIIDPVSVRALPHHSSDSIKGIANIHGRLHICVSLSAVLGIECASEGQQTKRRIFPRMIVIQRSGSYFVFHADEVSGSCRFAVSELLDVPATLSRSLARFSQGVFRNGEETVGKLDDELLFYTLEKKLI